MSVVIFNVLSVKLSAEYRPNDDMLCSMIRKDSLQKSQCSICSIEVQLSSNSGDPNQICYLGRL